MFKKYDAERDAYWCVVSGSNIWLEMDSVPFGSASALQLPIEDAIHIGDYMGHPVLLLNDSNCERTFQLTSLRQCLHFEPEVFLLLSKAVQYNHMTQTFRFCPQCGGRNSLNSQHMAMQCADCRTLHYPRIFPCIIVAVKKGNQILLAQHARHREGMHTVIAGFLEVGETLEQCVIREVKEETGLSVTNIRYFGSQPWAFPSSMMVAFLADYQSGDITPDHVELKKADWFSKHELPTLAPKGTIAREMIDSVMAGMGDD
ncbi:NAD(+) diphosphatase [Vibrio sp. S4M6]|uniref:NAD(+) diphosphatase n=1 Tax=Vibrio sinus TaxID=2946865 RepID=UPI00202ABEE3|nr:NAD(+) diphosphatase [Vibrio sinus]MCL9783835.1 NAD(+) diphosphatase [Vibrio sinus]